MPTPLLGAEHYGYPFAWLFRLILAPEYFPWRLDAIVLGADVVVWTNYGHRRCAVPVDKNHALVKDAEPILRTQRWGE